MTAPRDDKPKWTPGPWRDEGVKRIRAGKRDTHLITDSMGVVIAESDMDADARLIAAAPDLYAALESAPEVSASSVYEKWYLKVRAEALALAKGINK